MAKVHFIINIRRSRVLKFSLLPLMTAIKNAVREHYYHFPPHYLSQQPPNKYVDEVRD